MITPLLKHALSPVVNRQRNLSYLRTMAVWLAGFTLVALCFYLIRERFSALPLLLFIALFIIERFVRRRINRWEPDYQGIARRIESDHPELHTLLLTAVEQRPDARGQFGFLQQRVIQDTLAAGRKARWIDSVPRWQLLSWAGVVATLVVALFFLSYHTGKKRRPAEVGAAEKAKSSEMVSVTPGNASVERGSGLVVLAKFHRDVPSEAVLVVTPRNQPAQRIPLVRNLDDPVFGGGVPEVDVDLSYRVEYAGEVTRDFTVKVFEHPRLERADATLRFPDYTKLEEKKIADTQRVTAVEGTRLAVEFQLNKAVKSAELVAKDGKKIPLTVSPDKAVATLPELPIRTSQSYSLQLKDAEGRANKVPAQFIVDALPNRRPEMKIATPKGDVRVSPIEEIAFRAEVWDDFGLARYGLTYTVAGKPPQDVEFGRETKADEKQKVAHTLKLEDLGMKPDELISWHLWAEDTGPDGQQRSTKSDMYFAEVRPFEEIYRQGDSSESQGGQQSGQGRQAEKLAELQKQIITATWNLQRAEQAHGGTKPSEKYLEDIVVVRDSQSEALDQAKKLAENVEDPQSQALIENVTKEMETAVNKLSDAATTTAPLPEALTAEQGAYNALLKLAAHEFRITRSQSRSQSQSLSRRQQQQMDQLELKDEKKRYETKREAEPMQDEQQREQLAILNRLKELAQRQNDINERVKELQTALQEAKTEQEKEELRRQLKRLREEQQQMLADIDEAQQRMAQSPQQSQYSEDRKQLEQTRNEAQQAAEAMERQQASQALAAGTRAAENLEQLRDEFRKKTSGQFNEDMRRMRTDARELAQQQEELAEKLKPAPADKAERRTLDGSSPREQVAKQLEEQAGELKSLTNDMKRVSEQAEAAEPLLAKELYDALRKNAQAATDQTLEKTAMLAQRGLAPQAQQFEQKARQEINDLKTGVERAAEAVLGDEAEALRQARAEVDALEQELRREIARARPDLAQAGEQSAPDAQSARDQQAPGSTPAPGVGEAAPPSQASESSPEGQRAERQQSRAGEDRTSQEVRPGEAPGPTPGAGVLPGNPPPRAGEQPGERGQMAQNQGQQPNGQQPGESQPGLAGQQPGDQPGQQSGQRPGQQSAQSGQQPGQGLQPGQGQQPGQGRQPGQGQQPGQTAQNAQGQGGQQPGGQNADSQAASSNQDARDGNQRATSRLAELTNSSRNQRGPRNATNEGRGGGGGAYENEPTGPLTGERFVEWSDRLRNVEEMVDDANLRTEIARIREVAKGARAELKRHSVAPNWDMVHTQIGRPLAEIRTRLGEELARRESKENLVPIDRDPVPTKYAERVRRYYEELGRSR